MKQEFSRESKEAPNLEVSENEKDILLNCEQETQEIHEATGNCQAFKIENTLIEEKDECLELPERANEAVEEISISVVEKTDVNEENKVDQLVEVDKSGKNNSDEPKHLSNVPSCNLNEIGEVEQVFNDIRKDEENFINQKMEKGSEK
jgi:hypothetical protein